MKRFYCEKCNEILPKGNIECGKCGYVNERLYYKVQRSRTYTKVIIVLAAIAAIVGFLAICNAAMLYPWQYRARHNRRAILTYARENYPEAKIIEEYYPTMKFNPTGDPYDLIWFELDGIEFYIEARDGKVNYDNDGYGVALLVNEIREKYLDNFFLQQGLSYEPDISFLYNDYYWPPRNASLSTFHGSICLDIVLDYDNDKQFPNDYGWFFDFYCYWREVCPTDKFSLRFCYRMRGGKSYQLYCYSSSEFDNEDDFWGQFKYIS